MHERGWLTVKLHGNAYQSGLPDLLCWHPQYRFRMIETKTSKGSFTNAQKQMFHKIIAHGGMIWVIVVSDPPDDNQLLDQLERLHKDPNWYTYL